MLAICSDEVKPLMTVIADIYIAQCAIEGRCVFPIGKCAESATVRHTKITKFFFVFMLFLVISSNSFARTTVAVYRNKTMVVAGVDSKSSAFNGYTEKSVCKISRSGEMFWSFSGPSSGDYSKMIYDASINSKSFRQTVASFERIAPPIMERSLIQLRRQSPLDYRKFMDGGREMIFAFFGMERQIPFVSIVDFQAMEIQDSINVSKVLERVYDEADCPGGDTVCGNTIGTFKAILSYQSANPTWGDDLIRGVRNLVQLEIDDRPDSVGPPIRILKIDSKGPRWIQSGEGCDTGDIPKEPN
jgi:hypothetical protein